MYLLISIRFFLKQLENSSISFTNPYYQVQNLRTSSKFFSRANFIQKTFIKFITSIALFLTYSLSNAHYQQLYIPQIPKIIQLKLSEDILKEYHQNIKSLADSKIPTIEKINKQYFPLNIRFRNDAKSEQCEARARINGDWKDHIKPTEMISSLTIRLKECTLGGVTKFRLLLPETKNGSVEIFWSMLLEHYGFPTLYSQVVDVELNGITYKALFMEMPTSAFLERHGLRESPIIEADEQQAWNGRSNWFYHAYELNAPRHNDSSSPFNFWLDDDSFVYHEFGDFGSLDNKEYALGGLKSQIVMRALSQYITQRNVVNSDFFYQMQSIWAVHGLDHNAKMIYLPATNSFIPLYYDGMVNLTPNQESMPIESRAPAYFLEKCSDSEYFPNQNFSEEFLRRSREELSPEMKCVYAQIDKNLSHLNDWSQSQLERNIQTLEPPINFVEINPESLRQRLRSGFKGIYMDMLVMRGGEYLLCKTTEQSQICDPINFKRAHKILTKGDVTKIGEHRFVATSIAGELDSSIDAKGITIETSSSYDIDVNAGQKYYLYFKGGNFRNIHVNLRGPGARVIIYGELNDADNISFSGDAPNMFKNSRHDELMLTGCVTFLNVTFDNPTLSSAATGCEDSINILHSKGKIKKVSIQNATEDALDVDFSQLQIEYIDINNAGNDCLDISTGNYEIGVANLKSCGDKAVSAGEYADIKLDKVLIEGATLGLVAKDGAILMANEFKGVGIKDKCIDAYIKKRRFPIGRAYALSKSCEMTSESQLK